MSGAYYEKIARINLTTGDISVEPLDMELPINLSAVVVLVQKCFTMLESQPLIHFLRKTSSSTSLVQ